MIPYRCVAHESSLPGTRSGHRYAKCCVGTHVSTLQELVTYHGLDGPDAGRYFHATLSHWEMMFEAETPEEGT